MPSLGNQLSGPSSTPSDRSDNPSLTEEAEDLGNSESEEETPSACSDSEAAQAATDGHKAWDVKELGLWKPETSDKVF